MNDIRDIRPLILIPPWWYWLGAGLLAALLLVAVFFGVRYWRRRRERLLTPEQRARHALDRAEALANAGHSREWAELVAQTLREALAARLGHASCPETTEELSVVDFSKLPNGVSVDAPALVALLSTCDLTRFARGRLEAGALVAETNAARAWLDRLFSEPSPSARTSASAMPVAAEVTS